MSWQSKILDGNGKLVLLTNFESSRKVFQYLLVSEVNKKALFLDLKEKQNLNLDDYGEVVLSGWGDPTEEDKKFIREKYDANI